MKTNRRDFLTSAGVAVAATALPFTSAIAGKKKPSLDLGMASYTLRKFNLDQAIEMTLRVGLKHIALKSMHMPLDLSKADIQAAAKKVRDAGLDLYGAGVIYMKSEAEVHQAFDYAAAAEIKVIIGVPDHDLLGLVNKKVKEFDIKLAIHNHGPGDKVYPSPESAYEKVKDMDPRMGLCMDIGHTQRIGIDPSESVKKLKDRLHDVHIKDVSASTEEGKTLEIGRGVIDIPRFLKTLQKIKYTGKVSFEYEKDGDDPMPGLSESIGYVKGVLAVI